MGFSDKENVLWHTFAYLLCLKTSIIVYMLTNTCDFSLHTYTGRPWDCRCECRIQVFIYWNFENISKMRIKHLLKFHAGTVTDAGAVIRLSKLCSQKEEKCENETEWEKTNVISYALSCSLSPNLNIRVMPSFPFRKSFFFSYSPLGISILFFSIIHTRTHTHSQTLSHILPEYLIANVQNSNECWQFLNESLSVREYMDVCVPCSVFCLLAFVARTQHRNEYLINNPFL